MTMTTLIPRTNFESGTVINGYAVNGLIAEAIMTLHKEQIGKTSVYSPEYMQTLDGFLYKSNQTELFANIINYSYETMLTKQAEIEPLEKAKAMILIEMFANTTGQNIKEKIEQLLNASEIRQDSDEAVEFAKLVRVLDELFQMGKLVPREEYFSSEFVEIDPFSNELKGWNIVPVEVPAAEKPPVSVQEVSVEGERELTLGEIVENLFNSSGGKEIDLDTLFEDVNRIRPNTTKPALRGTVNRFVVSGFLSRPKRGTYVLASAENEQPKQLDLLAALEGREEETTFVPKEANKTELIQKEEKAVVEPKIESNEAIAAVQTETPKVPCLTMGDLKGLRPNFFSSESTIDYLKFMKVKQSIIDSLVLFRERQKERLTASVLADPIDEVIIAVREKPRYFGKTKDLEKAIVAIIMDQPLVFKGEAGSGKSTMIETLSSLSNLPLYEISGSLEANKDTLVGSPDIKEKGVLSTKDGMMTKAGKIGAILSVDEVNMMRPDITAIIHSFADHRKTFYNDVEQRTIVCNEFTRFVGAMNEKYKGTKELNEALKDRTAMIPMTYMSKADFKKMLEDFDGFTEFQLEDLGIDQLTPKDIKILTNIAGELQMSAKRGLIPVLAASTRNIITIAKMTRMLSYADAISMVVAKYDDEERQKIAGVLGANNDLVEVGITVEDILNY